ncbi:MAG: glycoside hydrolase family 88 protein [Planctomycetota bacterium]|nr:glycoside hydrolase family 88 protein [Planctomycetota bacterium]MDA1162663.1 glycoside hydrolase family 88 protein [Planctomycetota bacterium]
MVQRFTLLAACLVLLATPASLLAAEESNGLQAVLKRLVKESPINTKIGVTRNGTAIPAFLTPGMFDVTSKRTRILLVANLVPGSTLSQQLISEWMTICSRDGDATRVSFELGIIPFANPDRLEDASAGSNDDDWTFGFHPTGTAYSDSKNSERHYLWRWIGMLAPDIVVVLRSKDSDTIVIPEGWKGHRLGISANLVIGTAKSGSLADSLTVGKPSDVESVPAVEFLTHGRSAVLPVLSQMAGSIRSEARQELVRRRSRSPIEVAKELAEVYGRNLNSVAYIPALALLGRVRLSDLTGNENHLKDVLKIVEPYVGGDKLAIDQRGGGSNLSGHLIFGELAKTTEDRRFTRLVQAAADLGFDDSGTPRESMPFHNEMSDAVFMGAPILVQAGRLTGDTKYFDMAERHLKFMLKLNLRKDGLHQHSPLDPEHTAWGRGNGFPALGLALCLSDLPHDNPHRSAMVDAYKTHLTAMIKHQDEMGVWHQIVDHPESYREFTVTCMTTFAITRGLRNHWLDRRTFEPVVQRAWESIKSRIGPDGQLVDVCAGTGKQKSRQSYYDRPAILGRDDRGGAMALLVSTELAFADREGSIQLLDASAISR